MKQQIIERTQNIENEDVVEIIVKLEADDGKCLVNAKGHRFIHTITGKGLPIWCEPNEVSHYHEENL